MSVFHDASALESALPQPLVEAAAHVARTHGLNPGWINTAAAASFDNLVMEGALARADVRVWGGLTLRIASRADLITLKFRAAMRRGERGDRYRMDLAVARATDAELQEAARMYVEQQPQPTSEPERSQLVVKRIKELRDHA